MRSILKKGKSRRSLRFDVLTIFPEAFSSYLGESLLKRARETKLVDIRLHNIRDFTTDKHHKVDDRPFGGGPGMVMKVEPIWNAIRSSKLKVKDQSGKSRTRTILFSTRGKKLDNKTAKRLAKYDRLILICGRYEGVDERVAMHIANEELSIGDYVLSGGELPALVTIEAVSRFLPGFLGKYESLEEVSGSHPAYTRPEVFYMKDARKGAKRPRAAVIPKVLISGDHAKIEAWRRSGHSTR